ncbi:MAG: hypothetical protein JRF30_10750 [Deltaproteobacteria bacterium]|nr:hypothetical protein [Deltaproteobacteria bacterium]MBW2331373.1 hypothetical protein [Deltaproteobacteria bacterium]
MYSKPKDGDDYVLKASHRDEYFKVDDWVVNGIKEVSRSKLVRKKDDKEATKAGETSMKEDVSDVS